MASINYTQEDMSNLVTLLLDLDIDVTGKDIYELYTKGRTVINTDNDKIVKFKEKSSDYVVTQLEIGSYIISKVGYKLTQDDFMELNKRAEKGLDKDSLNRSIAQRSEDNMPSDDKNTQSVSKQDLANFQAVDIKALEDAINANSVKDKKELLNAQLDKMPHDTALFDKISDIIKRSRNKDQLNVISNSIRKIATGEADTFKF